MTPAPDDRLRAGGPIAYVMSRFPTDSETFVLFEMLELTRLGADIRIFPLIREPAVIHTETLELMDRVHHRGPLSAASLGAVAYWLARSPRRYLGTWARVLGGNARSPKFLVRAVAVMLQAGTYARTMQTAGVRRVHAHFATHPALLGYAIRRLTDIPYSFTAHAHDIYVNRTMLGQKIEDATSVVTISRFNKDLLASLYGPAADAKVSIIRCGVDTGFFAFRPRAEVGDPITIISVASLREVKGHRYLVEACAELRRRGVAVRCQLVGDGEARPAIEGLIAEKGLTDAITLLGVRPRDEVTALLAAADVMVLASATTANGQMEGIPVALMEALACGTPAIATRLSSMPELIEHERTGLLVEQRDPQGIADAVLRLRDDVDLRTRIVEGGRQMVERDYDVARNARALGQILT